MFGGVRSTDAARGMQGKINLKSAGKEKKGQQERPAVQIIDCHMKEVKAATENFPRAKKTPAKVVKLALSLCA